MQIYFNWMESKQWDLNSSLVNPIMFSLNGYLNFPEISP